MKAQTVLEEMDRLEKQTGAGPWANWNQLRHLLEQACATEEAAQQPRGEVCPICGELGNVHITELHRESGLPRR